MADFPVDNLRANRIVLEGTDIHQIFAPKGGNSLSETYEFNNATDAFLINLSTYIGPVYSARLFIQPNTNLSITYNDTAQPGALTEAFNVDTEKEITEDELHYSLTVTGTGKVEVLLRYKTK